jgi:hypothetical protein
MRKKMMVNLSINKPGELNVDGWVGSYITIQTGETYMVTSTDGNTIGFRELSWIEKLEWKFMKLKWWQIGLVVLTSMVIGGVLTIGLIIWYTNLIP